MNKLHYIGRMITVVIVFYLAYSILLGGNAFNMSIAAIINQSTHLQSLKHLIVLGLLPVYIGLMIFGSALLGIFLGSRLHRLFMRHHHLKIPHDKTFSRDSTG
jgi:hypothetical protein